MLPMSFNLSPLSLNKIIMINPIPNRDAQLSTILSAV